MRQKVCAVAEGPGVPTEDPELERVRILEQEIVLSDIRAKEYEEKLRALEQVNKQENRKQEGDNTI